MTLKDTLQRQLALDPTQSYIVQAPAGSGKTELLTQRFLRLLGMVQAPEQIVALTFTKKAANEMRERILAALHRANAGENTVSPHQQQTLTYATQALAQDHAQGWHLLSEPNRLRIITIDALCQRLAHAIPLHEHQWSFLEISDTPDRHYLQAAKSCLHFAIHQESIQPAIRTLLKHVDNRQETLVQLFSKLLAQRDQWLTPLFHAKMQQKTKMEDAIRLIEQHELTRLKNSLSEILWTELRTLTQRTTLIENNPNSPRHPLTNWNHIDDLNASLAASLGCLLLTSQQTLRKSFDHHVGIKRGLCPDEVYDDIKRRSQSILAILDDNPDFLDALLRVNDLPDPKYHPEQWEVLQALFTLLPLLVAHLNLIFNEHNEVDFTSVSQQALDALGEEDKPTDLALYLDHTIHHLLVDEFQDTSIQQYQLLSQLVHGWQPHDGRTLFVVGDPMQSIYRFRAAEVGLFLRAKTEGIGMVKLIPLQLSCNFRSSEPIVAWINQQFHHIFPQTDDMESGAVSFHPSVHTKPNDDQTQIVAQAFNSKETEADGILKIIQQEWEAHPNSHIAILVRSRRQLSPILKCLRAHHVPFQGIEIEQLADLPHIRDVWSLTQALLLPANRLAWLSFLRSPWCGISLLDLHHLANADRHQSIYKTLTQLHTVPMLSEEGRARCQFIAEVLGQSLAKRHQQPLVNWILNTLKALYSDHILDPKAQDDLEQFWMLIERYEQDGQIADMNEFNEQLKALYSKQVTPSRLQIMTIHKSKGLEFDCVILPGLSKKPSTMDKPLLRWLKMPIPGQEEILLISPMKAADQEQCRLYDYIGKLDAQKEEYERQRLLYVAATRAKKRLYLTDHQQDPAPRSFRQLLSVDFIMKEDLLSPKEDSPSSLPTLYRLPIEYYHSRPIPSTSSYSSSKLSLVDHTPKIIGIMMHEALQWLCHHHATHQDEIPYALIDHRLHAYGLPPAVVEETRQTIKTQLMQLFQCPIGQWILQPHAEERNEYELLIQHHHDIATRIIDRTFCENGIRWIIDFKTGHDHQDAQTQYHQQLNEYADILSQKYPDPIRCGLYYLSNNQWDEWSFSTADGKIQGSTLSAPSRSRIGCNDNPSRDREGAERG